jgi:hypothetical protein
MSIKVDSPFQPSHPLDETNFWVSIVVKRFGLNLENIKTAKLRGEEKEVVRAKPGRGRMRGWEAIIYSPI